MAESGPLRSPVSAYSQLSMAHAMQADALAELHCIPTRQGRAKRLAGARVPRLHTAKWLEHGAGGNCQIWGVHLGIRV